MTAQVLRPRMKKARTTLQALMDATQHERQERQPLEARTEAQMEALDKLVALLEGRGGQAPDPILRHRIKPNPLSQLAMLKAARASYQLATSEMERVGEGAYITHRHQ
jgi:predicted NAD/FAD-binding protein